MNPLAIQFLGSILRWALAGLSVYAVQNGIFTESEAAKYVEAAALALPPLLWSLYQKYKDRQKLVVALATPHVKSEQELEDHILNSITAGVALPPVTTPKHITPAPDEGRL